MAACAEALLDSLDGATRQLSLSHHFVTLVFVPNVGGVDSIITSCALSLKGNADFNPNPNPNPNPNRNRNPNPVTLTLTLTP